MSPALPTVAYVDHVGLSVPDLDEAVDFFRVVLGAEELYRSSRSADDDFMTRTFEVPANASFTLAMLRLPPNLNIELFQWHVDDQSQTPPRACDIGGHHLALYVEDIEQAYQRLQSIPGVRTLGELKTVGSGGGPATGNRWTYFVTPWGLQMELVNRDAAPDRPPVVVPGPERGSDATSSRGGAAS